MYIRRQICTDKKTEWQHFHLPWVKCLFNKTKTLNLLQVRRSLTRCDTRNRLARHYRTGRIFCFKHHRRDLPWMHLHAALDRVKIPSQTRHHRRDELHSHLSRGIHTGWALELSRVVGFSIQAGHCTNHVVQRNESECKNQCTCNNPYQLDG